MSSKSKRLAMARKQRAKTTATLKRLEAGEGNLAGIIAHPADELKRCRLWTVMMRAPHFGEKGIKKCLTTAKVWPETRLGNLTEDERQRIVQALPPRMRGDSP